MKQCNLKCIHIYRKKKGLGLVGLGLVWLGLVGLSLGLGLGLGQLRKLFRLGCHDRRQSNRRVVINGYI
jgi:hypothetical protein